VNSFNCHGEGVGRRSWTRGDLLEVECSCPVHMLLHSVHRFGLMVLGSLLSRTDPKGPAILPCDASFVHACIDLRWVRAAVCQ